MAMPRILACLVALLLVAAFFMPYLSAKEEYRAGFEVGSFIPILKNADMDVGDLLHISKYDIGRIFVLGADEAGISKDDSITMAVLTYGAAALSVLALLWALSGRPILLILTGALVWLADHVLRNLIKGGASSYVYDHGVAYWLYPACLIALAVLAIWMLIVRTSRRFSRK